MTEPSPGRAPRPRWRPLLAGEAAAEARRAIAEIVGELPAAELSATALEPNLGGGSAGLAVLFSYLAEDRPGGELAGRAESYLDHAVDGLARAEPGLYGGFTGIAWAASHLASRSSGEAADDGALTREIDEYLIELLDEPAVARNYDLVGGLAGLAVYLLELVPRPLALQGLDRILERLAETAVPQAGGLSWLTPAELVPPAQRRSAPEGYYNLGVAHGVPGVLAVLAAISRAGVAPERAPGLAEKTAHWLLAQRQDPSVGSLLPYWVTETGRPERSRLAWCYGDVGVAAALLPAARALERRDWEEAALEMARKAARRPFEGSGVVDAGICHGAAGLGHLFNRLFQATGDESLAAAARAWFRKTLELRRPGRGIGGYLAWDYDESGQPAWVAEPGILIGAAGIALALLGAVSSSEPSWDRILLTSLPGAPGPREGITS